MSDQRRKDHRGADPRFNKAEQTALTDRAHALATISVRAELEGRDCSVFRDGGILTIRANDYATTVVGQSSAGGHGKQGLHPERIALMRLHAAEGVPQRIVFVDQGGRKWQMVWLDIDEPEVVNIDNDKAHRRQGWRVRDMIRGEGLIPFPDEAPTPSARAQEALL